LRPAEGFGSSSGGGVVVKKGGKQAMLPPRGAFVVVVVVAADKEGGGNEGGRRRQGFRCVMGNGVMPDSMYAVRRWLPIGEGEMAGLAALAAVALAVECQIRVTSYQ